MSSTYTAAMEVLLILTPLDLLIMAEARMALYRLQITKQLAASEVEAGLLSILKNVSDPILHMWSDHTIPVYNHSIIFKVFIHWDYWRNEDPVFPEDALVWFTDRSRVSSGMGSGIFGVRPNRCLSFALGNFATVFQIEICAILQCAYENIRRAYRNSGFLFFPTARPHLRHLVARR
jgi:hypothetical protein